MARKRLNRKVALVGSLVFVLAAGAVIALIFHFNRDPNKFIEDGDVAVMAARAATEGQTKEEQYKKAERNYHQARARAKTDSARVAILFKLVDLYREMDQWRNVLACWNQVISIQPKNARARFGRLKYLYLLADSGMRGAWQEVETEASEFIEAVEQQEGLMTADTAEWDVFETGKVEAGRYKLGPYLYLVRGRARLEMARMGISTNLEQSLDGAVDDLKKVQDLEPANVDAYWYLALATVARGDIRARTGRQEEREEGVKSAIALLERAVEIAGNDPTAHINLLSMKLLSARGGEGTPAREQVLALEPEYAALLKKFPSNAEVLSAAAGYYQLTLKGFDRAIEAVEKAVALDKENVAYARNAANLHYTKFCIYGDKAELEKAVEIAKNATSLPGAQDTVGPREWANRMNRVSLFSLLAECYLKQVLEPGEVRTEGQTQEFIASTEQAVQEIQMLFGTGDAPQVIKWQGLLELAKGKRASAVRKMYAAYEQFRGMGQTDRLLSYHLAKVFEDSSELGAAREFMDNAARGLIDERKPEALLDYAELSVRLRDYGRALGIVNYFEDKYGARSRSQRIRVHAYVGAGQLDEAQKELAKMQADDVNTVKTRTMLLQAEIRRNQRVLAQRQVSQLSPPLLRSFGWGATGVDSNAATEFVKVELSKYWAELAGLVSTLLKVDPNSVDQSLVVALCDNYLSDGKVGEARALVEECLRSFADSTTMRFYARLLAEKEPGKVSGQRRIEIEEEVLSEIADPVNRAIELGRFYHRQNELEKAAVQFRKVFDANDKVYKATVAQSREPDKEGEWRSFAASYLFEIALATEDWKSAEGIADTARRENLDDCEGQFFAARLAAAREQYERALTMLDECLKQRPVFSHGYLLRSNVNAASGKQEAAIQDAQKAVSLNPLDGNIAKALAMLLYTRDRKLGNSVSAQQVVETRNALLRAISLNPQEWRLQSVYAEYISGDNPDEAIAVRQHLLRFVPNLENALLLGKMAMNMALNEINPERKKAFFEMAGAGFEQARAIDPQSKLALEAQAEYYRAVGQDSKALAVLQGAEAPNLLWIYHFRGGNFEEANRVLRQLYESNARDANIVRGLLLVAEKTLDQAGVKRYSEELLSLEDKVDDHLLQIQSYLKTGLLKEAGPKLESFKERYPGELRALLLESWLAMRQGQMQKALELVNRNLSTDRSNALAWQVRGEINFLMANYIQAIEDLKASKSLLPEPATRIALAKAYLRAGRVDDAITELKSTIEEAHSPAGSRDLLEQIYLRSDRKDMLRSFYAETLEKLPGSVYWHNRAASFSLGEGDSDRAEQLYQRALQITEAAKSSGSRGGQPSIAEYRASLDGYLRALVSGAGTPGGSAGTWRPAKLEKVLEEARKHIDSGAAPVAYYWMAAAKIKLGDKPTAVEYCRTALTKAFSATDDKFAVEVLQRVHTLLGAEETSKYCRQRLEAEPNSLAANLMMFNLLKINGDYNKATSVIDNCLRIVGAGSPRRSEYVVKKVELLELGYTRTSDKNYIVQAIKEYESLLAEMPNNIIVLNNFAYMLAENSERLVEALGFAKRAYDMMPNNPNLMDTYGYVLFKNGRNSEAEALLKAAVQQYEQSDISAPAEVYEHLGRVKEALGAKTEAMDGYKRALEAGAETLSETAKERIKAAIERLSQ